MHFNRCSLPTSVNRVLQEKEPSQSQLQTVQSSLEASQPRSRSYKVNVPELVFHAIDLLTARFHPANLETEKGWRIKVRSCACWSHALERSLTSTLALRARYSA